MLANLTVGRRINLGFGTLTLFLVLLAGAAWYGVSVIVADAGEIIRGHTLDATLTQKEVDHLNWAQQVGRELDDPACTRLTVQTDDHKCGFGKWLYSEERTAAEERVPSIAPLLKEVEKVHADLHNSAVAIDGNLQHEHPGLDLLLANRMVDHVIWVNQVAQSLVRALSQAPATTGIVGPPTDGQAVNKEKRFSLGVQTNPDLCGFGKFLAAQSTTDLCAAFPEMKTALDACREPHQRLHQTAVEIEKLVNEAKTAEAVAVFEAQTQKALSEVKQHFEEAIAAENKLKEGALKARSIFAQQTKPALEQTQALLAKIRKEAETHIMQDEVMLSQARAVQRNVAILGLVALALAMLMAFSTSRAIVKTLKRVIGALSDGADQVNDAAGQVSSASQQLAGGASEQASNLEETSSALEQVAAMTRTNAGHAKQANDLAGQARLAAESGDKTMAQLNQAMTGINESSEKISKIIKVIEEIAFQTNLLALNAAVEAARAGEHGKGFAVVADEVRNLAMRAAQAAQETTGLIEDAVSKSQQGAEVAKEVGKALGEIVTDVSKVSELINGISQASQEQSQSVDQVNSAVSEMDKVTQQNAAGAEESASAAEELAAQAQAVKGTINELSKLVGGSEATALSTRPRPRTMHRQAAAPRAKPRDVAPEAAEDLVMTAAPSAKPAEELLDLEANANDVADF